MATAFADHLRALESFLRRDSDAPCWTGVRVVKDKDIVYGPKTKIPRSALYSVEDFTPKFDRLIASGYGWINLVGNGLLGGKLLVSVEVPRQVSGLSAGDVKVNLSGPYSDPSGHKRWNLEEQIEVV